jgi:hypothetical protein
MAKAKKRVAARKKSSKRGKARKKAAKHTTSKKAKSKVRAGKTSPKSVAKKKRSPKTTARRAPRQQVVEVPVEDTIIDVIEEPVPGTVVVTEYETVRIGTPVSSNRKSKRRVGPETEEQ